MVRTKDIKKGLYSAVVVANRQVGRRFWVVELEFAGAGVEALGKARPGQFAEFDLASAPLPAKESIPEEFADAAQRQVLLRRPFSFTDVRVEGDKVAMDVFYRVVGAATVRMTGLQSGDCVTVIGPLGNGFKMPEKKKRAILVAGGMGTPPLQHLAKVLSMEFAKIETVAFVGAKNKAELPYRLQIEPVGTEIGFYVAQFAQFGVKSLVTTDDGSVGCKGFVTQALEKWLGEGNVEADETIIYACGPGPMAANVAKVAEKFGIECQISLERRMGCGIGICQSCAVECRQVDSDETIYKLCCKDGPVFDSKEIVF